MKKKIKNKPLSILILCVTFVVITSISLLGILIYNDWQKIQSTLIDGRPAEHLVESILSPDGLHRMDIYRNDGKGATVAESSVVIITANEDGKKWEDKDRWCLYYAYPYPNIAAEWMDNENVTIHNTAIRQNDGYVSLNIYQNEYYHKNSTDR